MKRLSSKDLGSFLFRYLKRQRKRLCFLAAVLSLSIAASLAGPQILKAYIDQATSEVPSRDLLIGFAVAFCLVAIAQQGLSLVSEFISQKVAWLSTNRLRSELLRHCIRLDMGFHNQQTPGGMIERIDGDVNRLSNFFSNFIVVIAVNFALFLGVQALLYRENWRVGLFITVFCCIAIGIMLTIRNLAIPHWKATRGAETEMFGFLEERLGGTEDIRSLNAKPYVLDRFYKLTRSWYLKARKAWQLSNLTSNSQMFMRATGLALGLGVGAYFYVNGQLTIGGVYLIAAYIALIWEPIQRFAFQAQELQQAAASVERIVTLQQTKPMVKEQGTSRIADSPLTIEYRAVSFSYQERSPALEDVSFQIKAKSSLGLIGRTGSGKSTLVRLLFRLFDPKEGQVLINGQDIKTLSIESLRSRISMVPQTVQLFQGSIRDNLTFFDQSVSDKRILDALEQLDLLGWLGAQPDGLDTNVVDSGKNLSAGEAQLLAFTRVFLGESEIVILDEASSKLDRASEDLIERSLRRLIHDRTAIIIAHHLGTLKRVDEILLLDRGRVLEHGKRSWLEADPRSRFRNLMRSGMEEYLT